MTGKIEIDSKRKRIVVLSIILLFMAGVALSITLWLYTHKCHKMAKECRDEIQKLTKYSSDSAAKYEQCTQKIDNLEEENEKLKAQIQEQ